MRKLQQFVPGCIDAHGTDEKIARVITSVASAFPAVFTRQPVTRKHFGEANSILRVYVGLLEIQIFSSCSEHISLSLSLSLSHVQTAETRFGVGHQQEGHASDALP